LAEYERELVKERTALKRASSRANGTKFGRPRKVDDTEHITTAKRMKSDGHTGKDIAKYLGVSRATLYRYFAASGDGRLAGVGHFFPTALTATRWGCAVNRCAPAHLRRTGF